MLTVDDANTIMSKYGDAGFFYELDFNKIPDRTSGKKYHYDKECYEGLKKYLSGELKAKFDALRNENIPQGRNSSGFIVAGDSGCMALLMSSINKNGACIKTNQFDSNRALRAKLHKFSSELSLLSTDKLEALYNYSLSLLNGRQATPTDEFFSFKKLIEDMNRQNVYFFLIFEFPYLCRCNLIHGAKAPLLLSYESEPEIRQLRAASFFVEKFLAERIPLMITGETKLSEELLNERNKKIKDNEKDVMEKHKRSVEELIAELNASHKSIT